MANELFTPRRMAYVVDLTGGDEADWRADSDIPTTLLRSKADCPQEETATSLSVNDVVIQKLSQVLGYLRADNKRKRAARDKMITDASGSGGGDASVATNTNSQQQRHAAEKAKDVRYAAKIANKCLELYILQHIR